MGVRTTVPIFSTSKLKHMKTINSKIDYFITLGQAVRAFDKTDVPCHLLEHTEGTTSTWFVDKSKKAIVDWPTRYKLLMEK